MKNIYSLLLLALTNFAVAQTTIFTENFGSPSGTTTISTYTGFQNASPIVYTGNSDVRNTFTSTGYTDASGAGCLFIGATTPATAPEKFLTISGIKTSEYKDMSLSFGHYNGVANTSFVPKVEVSTDGTSWTALSYARVSTNSSVWEYVTASGNIPATDNLRIRFTNTVDSAVGYRIDDIKLVGTKESLAVNSNDKKTFNIYPTVVSNGVISITSANNQTKNVKIYDSSAKLVISRGTQKEINVSQLPKGTYIMNVEENGVVESAKFIVK